MKKLIIILVALLGFGYISKAQNAAIDQTLGYNDTYIYFTGAAADTVGYLDSLWTYTVRKKNTKRIWYDVYLDIDTVVGLSDSTVVYWDGRTFTDRSWTNIQSDTYYGTADTTINFIGSAVKNYEYWRLRIQGTNDNFKGEIQQLDIKFLNE